MKHQNLRGLVLGETAYVAVEDVVELIRSSAPSAADVGDPETAFEVLADAIEDITRIQQPVQPTFGVQPVIDHDPGDETS